MNVFVYGTLKPGEANYQHFCAGKVLKAKRAIAFGQLFALPFGYPAMIAGKDRVQGFLLSFPDETVLSELDWLEDYQPNRPAEENEYDRREIEIYEPTLASSLGVAWAYLMAWEQVHSHSGVLLPNGQWSSHDLATATSL